MTQCVVALMPDEQATEAINRLKSKLRDLVGPQQYLDDEPHVTLYVGDLDIESETALDIPRFNDPQFEITGWEVFRDDTVTGNHSLTCQIESRGIHKYQKEVAAKLQTRRQRTMIKRYEEAYDSFDEQRQANLAEYGYPFIGTGWKPHLTIASIDPNDFEKAWRELEDLSPVGTYEFTSITLYNLVDGDLYERTNVPI